MRSSIVWMAKNPVVANMLMTLVVVAGFISMRQIKLEVIPDVSTEQIQIEVVYLGASPEEVEEGVCQRIEDQLSGLEGVRRIRSIAAEGLGMVLVELAQDVDINRTLNEIKIEVDRIDTFPEETEKPVIKEFIRRNRVIEVVVYGNVPEEVLKVAARRVRDDLRLTDGISQVELEGVRDDEISIEVSEQALRRYGLTFDQVREAVARTSLDMPGGSVKTASGEILVRTKGLKYIGSEYEEVVVFTRPDGTTLKLSQIATVVDGFENSDLISRFNGQPAALIPVFRVGRESALEISEKVHAYIASARMPAGVHIDYTRDTALTLKSRLNLVLKNAWMGLILVFLCLSLFLDLHLAFWVMMGIPISFIGAFVLMHPFDASINMVSLFAFIVALGIVVDDAIVVGENVFAYRERLEGRHRRLDRKLAPGIQGGAYGGVTRQGKVIMRAAIDGVLDVTAPVVFSVLTSIAAFLPLMMVGGVMGKFMGILPVIVTSILLVSLIEALYILPAHLTSKHGGKIGRRIQEVFKAPLEWQAGIQNWVDRHLKQFIDTHYHRALKLALVNPFVTLAVGVALLLATLGWVAGGHIRFNLISQVGADWITASLVMPQGTTRAQTQAVVQRIERAAVQVRDEYDRARGPNAPSILRNVYSVIGDQPRGRLIGGFTTGPRVGSQAHLAEVTIELLPAEARHIPSGEILGRVRERAGEIPGVESLSFFSTIFSAGNPIEVQLTSADFAQLLRASDRLKAEIATYPGAGDIRDSFYEGKLEMKLTLKPRARTLGITQRDLARQVRQGFYGDEVLRLQRDGDDVRVMVRYPENERVSLKDIEGVRIRTPSGAEVPFSQVAEVELGHGFAAIHRSDGQRVVTVTADVDDRVASADEINRDLAQRFLPALVQDYPGLRYSFEGEDRERRESMQSLGRVYILAMVVIYGLIAIPFRSYTQPLVVMIAIPFGIIGAIWGHVLMGIDMSFLTAFGIVALSGVVVNDSLVLISFYNQLRLQGLARDEALMETGKQRFRPILLTSLTTFFGLLPMILEKSLQAQFLIPMAVSLGFGILFATAIVLLGVPAAMRVLSQLLELFGYSDVPEEEEDQTYMVVQAES